MNTRYHLYFAAASALAVASTAAALGQGLDWTREAPHPFPMQSAAEMAFLDNQTGFMAGLRETPLVTHDGGHTWQIAPLPNNNYTCAFALDDQHIWMFGNYGAKSSDGGQTWQDLGFHTAWETKFLTPQFGWTSDNYAAQVTHDGGSTWTFAMNGNSRVIYPDFANNQIGVGVLESYDKAIWRTADGGRTWREVSPINATQVRFMSETVALAVADGRIYRSADAGLTWTNVAAGHTPYPSIVVFDADTAIVSSQSAYSHTSDGGLTWTRVTPPADNLLSVHIRDGLDAFGITGYGGIVHSTDGFRTWQQLVEPTYLITSDMEFLPDGSIVGAGTDFVMRSEDDGVTWNATSSGVSQTTIDVDMFDSQRGLALANGGYVLRTEDGGNQWVAALPSYVLAEGWNYCTDLFVLDDQIAYVAGNDGPSPMLKTSDGGVTWETLAYPTTTQIQSIWFVDEQHGWIGRGYTTGWIYRTADGGTTWDEVWPQSFGGIWDIQFHDLNLGWALRGGRFVLRTIDGGNSWTEAPLPSFGTCVKFAFAGQNVGYAVGAYGAVCKSVDGGRSWVLLDAGTGEHLHDVHVLSETELYICGANNTFRYSDNGGATWSAVPISGVELPQYQNWYSIDRLADGTMRLSGSYGFIISQPGSNESCLDLAVENLVAGQIATITISGGTPGANAVTVYGLQPGSTRVNNLSGYCATFGIRGLSQQNVIGGLNRTFDANGMITFTTPVPSNASGARVLFQSAQHGTCPDECMSNLFEATVQ